MPWSELLGHDRAVESLRRAVASDRLHHALLLHGPEGVGKSLAARLLAQALLCEKAGGEGSGFDPCGSCHVCRRIEGGNHPDVALFGLEESSSTGRLRQDIVIDQIRELGRFVSIRPMEAPRRVAIVDPADRMNQAAANAFLKTLEEPPGGSQLILIARNRSSLLETIRSRCRPVSFGRVGAALIEKALREGGASPGDAKLAAALADGAMGRARTLVAPREGAGGRADSARDGGATELEAYRERRDRVLAALREAAGGKGGPGSRAIRAADAFSAKDAEEFRASFDLATALIRDVLLVSAGGPEPVAAADQPERVAELARLLGERRAASALAAAERIRGDFRLNLNRQLAVESLLAELAV